MDKFTYSIFKFATENHLISAGDRVIISLSGGIDSMSLYMLLDDFKEKIDINIHLVHFHHGLRPESDGEAEYIEKLAQTKNTPITILKADHLKGKKGMQNRAREWRYENLEKIKFELKFNKIATAHQLDDLIETQIWRILRGGSLFTFNALQVYAPPYIRPLLHTPKSELQKYLEKRGQKWCEDASNRESGYTRNKIRNQIIPLMREISGGNFESKFLDLNTDAIELKSFFDKTVDAKVYQSQKLSFDVIQSLNPIFARELIHRYLLYNDQIEITRANIDDIYQLVLQNLGNWKIQLKGNCFAYGKSKTIHFITESSPKED